MQDSDRGKKRKFPVVEAGGESPLYSGGAWREGSGKVVAEAGMILRDPSALHLIIQQVTHTLSRLVMLFCVSTYPFCFPNM